MAEPPDLDLIKPYTKSTPERIASMVDALMDVEQQNVPGDVVECGVWRGGNIMLARMMAPTRVCWMFDTFDGMTEPDEELDVKRDGERAIDRYHAKIKGGTKWNAVSIDDVLAGFRKLGLLSNEHMRVVLGPIEDILAALGADLPKQIAILRLDVDWYLPTKIALEQLYPRVSAGGFLIVDDYGHWMGCQKAVDDYFGENVPSFYDADYSCRVFSKC